MTQEFANISLYLKQERLVMIVTSLLGNIHNNICNMQDKINVDIGQIHAIQQGIVMGKKLALLLIL